MLPTISPTILPSLAPTTAPTPQNTDFSALPISPGSLAAAMHSVTPTKHLAPTPVPATCSGGRFRRHCASRCVSTCDNPFPNSKAGQALCKAPLHPPCKPACECPTGKMWIGSLAMIIPARQLLLKLCSFLWCPMLVRFILRQCQGMF
jgi:hypothetical protein